jgi:uroporphyrinogen decarboxylase
VNDSIRKIRDATRNRTPDFENFLRVLRREKPDRPTLGEFFIDVNVLAAFCGGQPAAEPLSGIDAARRSAEGFRNAGYDYFVVQGIGEFRFEMPEPDHKETISLNASGVIAGRTDFEAYPWPDPDDPSHYEILDRLPALTPAGMKAICCAPLGLLETVVRLVGFENLCIMTCVDPLLSKEIFDEVGRRLLRFYQICAGYPSVGAVLVNDDWGFKTQTMLNTADMRSYVIPWHRKMVAAAHEAGKPAVIHSCGNLVTVMDDIIDDIRFDGKHSYEDTICPVERAFELWGSRIAIIGGIDMDFLTRSSPAAVRDRVAAMLVRTEKSGGWAVGSGNSIPAFVPIENYCAMLEPAVCAS